MRTYFSNEFEEYASHIDDSECRLNLLQVADNCFLASKWFESHDLEYTAGDVLRLAEMIERRVAGGKTNDHKD